jgi:hypothetical protein
MYYYCCVICVVKLVAGHDGRNLNIAVADDCHATVFVSDYNFALANKIFMQLNDLNFTKALLPR